MAGPLAVFALVIGGVATALPAADPAAPPAVLSAGVPWFWAVLAAPALAALWLLLRRPRGLPGEPVPGGLLVVMGLLGIFLALMGQGLIYGIAVTFTPEGEQPGPGWMLAAYAGGWLMAAVLCVRVVAQGEPRPRWAAIAIGAACYPLTLPLLMIVGFANAWLLWQAGYGAPLQPVMQQFLDSPGLGERLLLATAIVVLAPVCEEIVFRGVLYRGLREIGGPVAAAVGSALLFSTIHLAAPQALLIVFLGVVLALVYERTGSLAAPITIHVLQNGIALLTAG